MTYSKERYILECSKRKAESIEGSFQSNLREMKKVFSIIIESLHKWESREYLGCGTKELKHLRAQTIKYSGEQVRLEAQLKNAQRVVCDYTYNIDNATTYLNYSIVALEKFETQYWNPNN